MRMWDKSYDHHLCVVHSPLLGKQCILKFQPITHTLIALGDGINPPSLSTHLNRVILSRAAWDVGIVQYV